MKQEARELARHMFEKLGTPARHLTKWEEDFIASLKEQFETKDFLSPRQMEILERIYEEKS